jgi:hypothetical protein
MLNKKALAASVSAGPSPFVEDVFSTYLYTGNGSTQTITNGIDLAGEGGLVWLKGRQNSALPYHFLMDSSRGKASGSGYKWINSNTTDGEGYDNAITSFNSNGVTLGSSSFTNDSGFTFASWTFRKAPKFFDVVTYTGNGVDGRSIAHNLGSTAGFIVTKPVSASGGWLCWHRSLGTNGIILNSVNASAAYTAVVNYLSQATSDNLIVGTNDLNQSGVTYVAYLFAHDAGGFGAAGTDNVISCGMATYPTSGDVEVNLGWEPQFVLYKDSGHSGPNWTILDTMRGWAAQKTGGTFSNITGGPAEFISANSSNAASSTDYGGLTSTGFKLPSNANYEDGNTKVIYMAIRRPMKVPTTGTEVFSPVARTGTGAAATISGVGFTPDFVIPKPRNNLGNTGAFDRLRGALRALLPNSTDAEFSAPNSLTSFNMDGASVSSDIENLINANTYTYINYFFRRAPNFFDVVCTSVFQDGTPITHNLGVTPELIIVKTRSSASNWMGAVNDAGNIRNLSINTTSGGYLPSLTYSSYFNATTINPAGIFNGGGGSSKGNPVPVVIYLFATCAGVSKVGSYTGNGTTQAIACGFTGGARFVLIKRTDSTGDWYVWDTARGIVSGNDPHSSINNTNAEVTSDDSVDPDSSGFVVNQLSATNINVSSASYIFLAIA